MRRFFFAVKIKSLENVSVKVVPNKTHHTLSIHAGIVGLTDVASLGTTCGSIAIALVSRRAGAYRETGTWWR